MSTCSDCDALIKFLHSRTCGRSHTHKGVTEILRAAPACDLCNLIVSVPLKFQDDIDPPVSSISLFNTNHDLQELEKWAESDPDDFLPMQVFALEDITARNSEIVFEFKLLDRKAIIRFAIWKDYPCADIETECTRHKEDFISEHLLHSDPAENRWAQFGFCSTSDIAFRPYGVITEDDSIQTLNILRNWLKICEYGLDHGQCCKSFSGELIDGGCLPATYAKMPTRVIDIEADVIRLVETQTGDTGEYIALSHCWGGPENHPLKTTHANYNDHMNGLQLNSLPKTFKDAVKIARHLGVKYLWIDSLCIIQDDVGDWKKEAACMGAVYEYAKLTIAAAGAQNSTEGCFVTIRPNLGKLREVVLETMEVRKERDGVELDRALRTSPPTFSTITMSTEGNNGVPVTIHFGARSLISDDPTHTSLGSRGWARQEWYLSRRILFFTEGGISWKCRNGNWSELERSFETSESPNCAVEDEWVHLLQRYSRDELTYETDRLVALQGVATQTAAVMQGGTYHFGLWTHKPELLFWIMKGPQQDVQGPPAPSWSWASRKGHKYFFASTPLFMLGSGTHDLTQNGIQIDDDTGKLSTSAPIRDFNTADVSDAWIQAERFPIWNTMVPESVLIYIANFNTRVIFLLDPSGSKHRAIGIAALDDRTTPVSGKVFCVFITLSTRLWPLKPEHDTTESNGSEDSQVQVESGSDEDNEINYEAKGNKLFWVLLVQEVEGAPDCFRRIGMGIMDDSVHGIPIPYKTVNIM